MCIKLEDVQWVNKYMHVKMIKKLNGNKITILLSSGIWHQAIICNAINLNYMKTVLYVMYLVLNNPLPKTMAMTAIFIEHLQYISILSTLHVFNSHSNSVRRVK